jgi:hypothetical protein
MNPASFFVFEMFRARCTIELTKTWEINVNSLSFWVNIFVIDDIFVFEFTLELVRFGKHG